MKHHFKIQQYIGSYQGTFFAYAKDKAIRDNAASGGVVTALLSNALSTSTIDGALVCHRIIDNGRVRGRLMIAETQDDLIKAQGSTYVTIPFNETARELIRNFKGRIGVVGLPCNIQFIRSLCRTDLQIDKNIVFSIALFCGHLSNSQLIDFLTRKLEHEAGSSLKDLHFRRGHWRGHLGASFQNGRTIKRQFSWFSLYQNLYFFCEKKCLMCNDHFGFHADLSVGDIWSSTMKSNPIKHSAVIVKTDIGSRIISDSIQREGIVVENAPIQLIYNGQKRVAPTHYNTRAKQVAGKILGVKLSSHVHGKLNPVSIIIAFFILLNYRISKNITLSKFIINIPRPFLKLYLYFFKALETLQ